MQRLRERKQERRVSEEMLVGNKIRKGRRGRNDGKVHEEDIKQHKIKL